MYFGDEQLHCTDRHQNDNDLQIAAVHQPEPQARACLRSAQSVARSAKALGESMPQNPQPECGAFSSRARPRRKASGDGLPFGNWLTVDVMQHEPAIIGPPVAHDFQFPGTAVWGLIFVSTLHCQRAMLRVESHSRTRHLRIDLQELQQTAPHAVLGEDLNKVMLGRTTTHCYLQ